MPTYSFRDKATKREWEEFMTISEREIFLASNPQVEQFPSNVRIGDPFFYRRLDGGFTDLLKEMRRKHRSALGQDTTIKSYR